MSSHSLLLEILHLKACQDWRMKMSPSPNCLAGYQRVKSLFCSLIVLLIWKPSPMTAPQPSLTGAVAGGGTATLYCSSLPGLTYHDLLLRRCFPTFCAVLCVPSRLLPLCTLPLLTRSPEAPNTNSASLALGLCPHLQTLLPEVSGFPVASRAGLCCPGGRCGDRKAGWLWCEGLRAWLPRLAEPELLLAVSHSVHRGGQAESSGSFGYHSNKDFLLHRSMRCLLSQPLQGPKVQHISLDVSSCYLNGSCGVHNERKAPIKHLGF